VNILLILDSEFIEKSCHNMFEEKHKLTFCKSSDNLDKTIIADGFDLIVIDRDIPDDIFLNNIETVKRYDDFTQIILINCDNNPLELKKLYALDIVDCLKKPFLEIELKIKIDKIFEKEYSKIIYFNENFFYNMDIKQFYYNKLPILLSKKENLFSNLLIKRINTVVTHETINQSIFEENIQDLTYSRKIVSNLRKKLPINIIKTVSRVGYMISSEIEDKKIE